MQQTRWNEDSYIVRMIREKVASTIGRSSGYKEMKLGTQSAKNLWLLRLNYYIGFYQKLKAQLDSSASIG